MTNCGLGQLWMPPVAVEGVYSQVDRNFFFYTDQYTITGSATYIPLTQSYSLSLTVPRIRYWPDSSSAPQPTYKPDIIYFGTTERGTLDPGTFVVRNYNVDTPPSADEILHVLRNRVVYSPSTAGTSNSSTTSTAAPSNGRRKRSKRQ